MDDIALNEMREWFRGLTARMELQAALDALLLAAAIEEARGVVGSVN